MSQGCVKGVSSVCQVCVKGIDRRTDGWSDNCQDGQTDWRTTDSWGDRQVCACVCQVCALLCQVCLSMANVS